MCTADKLDLVPVYGETIPAFLPFFTEGKTSRNNLIFIPNHEVEKLHQKKIIEKLSSRVRLNGLCFSNARTPRKNLIIRALKMESFSWFLTLPKEFYKILHRFYLLAYDAPVARLGRMYSNLIRITTKSLGPRQRHLIGYMS